ncbi:MAG TPA: preprotein translocase subunit YajC [Candidatus Methylomirabilis sp.]|nr:preprotein translocase subunit YajC [Candidatus Methylomirabilis sp.]
MSELAYAMGPAPGGGASGGGFSMLVPLLLMFAVFYFLLIRPQQRKQRTHQDMLKSLKVGDRVITTGGLVGTIVDGGEQTIKLEIADRVRVEVGRTYIAGRIGSRDSKEAQTVPAPEGQPGGSRTGSSTGSEGGLLSRLFKR